MTRKHRGAGEPRTSPRRITAIERQRQALELRKAGCSYRVIADQLGYANASGAIKAVAKALRASVQEPAAELRTLELERLDSLLRALWPQAIKGNTAAVDRVLKIMDRRAGYLGLDAPARFVGHVGIDRAAAEELAEQYGLDPGQVIAEAEHMIKLYQEGKRGIG